MTSIFDAPLDESRIRFADLSAGDGLSLAEIRAGANREPDEFSSPGAAGEAIADVARNPAPYGRLAEAAYRQTLTGELTTSRQIAQETGYDSIIATVRNASGVQLENPMRGAYLDQVPAYRAEAGLSPEPIENRPDIVAAQAAIFEQKLDALAQGNPELARVIGAARELYSPSAVAQRADAEFKAAYEAAPSGAGALAASIAGGLPAMLRDPVNVAGLFVTGGESAAASVAGRIVSTLAREAIVNAGLTAAAQPLVQLERADLGLESGWREGASNIAMAALLGAGFGTVFGAGREIIGSGPLKGLRPDDLPSLERGILDHAAGAEISDRAARAGAPAATVEGFSGARVYEQAVDYVQGRDAPPPELLLDLPEPEPRRQRVTREELPARPGETSTVDGKPVRFERFEPSDLATDAAAFQYKGGGDAAGVTERLRSVTQWDPVASGKVLVFEAEDGLRFVADGHQRLGLAKRLSATDESIRLDGFLFKERDGWTRADVRALAAKKNMQEGSGDALDAARVLRDRPDLADGSLPTTAPMMRQALALARLSDEAWGMTLNGVVPPSYAAAVGGTVADPLQHAAVLSLLREAQPETERAARLLIGEAMEAGFTVDRQIDLFGAADATRSLMGERVAVLDAALTALRKDARLFGVLARSADAIEGAGNVLARGQNEARAMNAAGLEDILVKLARRAGPISDALTIQAARVADGTARTTASKAFLDQLQAVVETRGLIGLLKDSVELKPAATVEPGTPEAARATQPAPKPAKAAPAPATAPETPLRPATEANWTDLRPADAADAPAWAPRIQAAFDALARGFGVEPPRLSVGKPRFPENGPLFGINDRRGNIVLSEAMSEHHAINNAIHEFGHEVQFRLYDAAPQETRDAIQQAFRAATRRDYGTTSLNQLRPITATQTLGGAGQPARITFPRTGDDVIPAGAAARYQHSFEEWFAEQVSRWLTTDARPVGVVDQFFSGIAQAWKRIYERIAGHTPLDDRMKTFLDGRWRNADTLDQRYEAWKSAPADARAGAARAYLADWEAGLAANRSAGMASEPNSGSNVARQTGSAMTEPEWATSTASAGDQSASGSALTKADAPSTESTAGRDLKSRKYIEASGDREADSLRDLVPMGERDDGRDARLLTREAALAEADRVELYSDLVAACRG